MPARRARWGCGGDADSPSCRPGVSNEWYEFPARPLIASSKTFNELLLLLLQLPTPRSRPCRHRCTAQHISVPTLGTHWRSTASPAAARPCPGPSPCPPALTLPQAELPGGSGDPKTVHPAPLPRLRGSRVSRPCSGWLRRRENTAPARHLRREPAQIPLRHLSSPPDLQAAALGAGSAVAPARLPKNSTSPAHEGGSPLAPAAPSPSRMAPPRSPARRGPGVTRRQRPPAAFLRR